MEFKIDWKNEPFPFAIIDNFYLQRSSKLVSELDNTNNNVQKYLKLL